MFSYPIIVSIHENCFTDEINYFLAFIIRRSVESIETSAISILITVNMLLYILKLFAIAFLRRAIFHYRIDHQ
jgi:hypothetical protein